MKRVMRVLVAALVVSNLSTRHMRILALIFGLAMLFVFPNAARAQFLVVDCSGANPYAFPTINSALPSAGPGAFIAVTGACNENVGIYGALNLTLGASYGQTVTLDGNLSISNSQNVYLYGLNVTNNFGDGIDITSSRSVVLDTCSSSGNAGNGLAAGTSSDVSITAVGTFRNNGNYGIRSDNNNSRT